MISLRTGWDPEGMEHDRIRREYDAYADAGVQHVVTAPWRSDLDDWLRSMDTLAGLVTSTDARSSRWPLPHRARRASRSAAGHRPTIARGAAERSDQEKSEPPSTFTLAPVM